MAQNIFPIAYFGNLEYYQKITSHKEVIFDIGEHYTKQTIRNRTQILGPNGVQNLSLHVSKPFGNKTATKDIILCEQKEWAKVHWRSIKTAYSASPFFEHYERDIYEMIHAEHKTLVDFNLHILQRINAFLDLNIEFKFSEHFIDAQPEDSDYRQYDFDAISPKIDIQYFQIFPIKDTFVPNLSILDALFSLGPMARTIFIK